CEIDKARVRITRWQYASAGALSPQSNSVRFLQQNDLSLAHLLASKTLDVDVEGAAWQVQASLQSYIGDLLDPCEAAKTPLHRVA
ncbi:MAG: hypothetical protein KJO24_06745, partial [Gammaproteobacteria bacterium]|nr:hypothetical protein [Gammaproteobacteria bacterium]